MAAKAMLLLLVGACGVAQALVAPRPLAAARRASLVPRDLFSGAPPEQPAAPPPGGGGGGGSMTIPGLGQISEEEMRLVRRFKTNHGVHVLWTDVLLCC